MDNLIVHTLDHPCGWPMDIGLKSYFDTDREEAVAMYIKKFSVPPVEGWNYKKEWRFLYPTGFDTTKQVISIADDGADLDDTPSASSAKTASKKPAASKSEKKMEPSVPASGTEKSSQKAPAPNAPVKADPKAKPAEQKSKSKPAPSPNAPAPDKAKATPKPQSPPKKKSA